MVSDDVTLTPEAMTSSYGAEPPVMISHTWDTRTPAEILEWAASKGPLVPLALPSDWVAWCDTCCQPVTHAVRCRPEVGVLLIPGPFEYPEPQRRIALPCGHMDGYHYARNALGWL
jgi:hypothetical protein